MVCGGHFHSGEAAPLWDKHSPDWVPSLNLGHDKLNQSATKESDTATKVEELKGSLREGNIGSNDRKKMSSNKKNKPDEPVKHILQQFDNRPMPSDVVPDIEDVTLEVENLVLNKDIGVQTDEFSCL